MRAKSHARLNMKSLAFTSAPPLYDTIFKTHIFMYAGTFARGRGKFKELKFGFLTFARGPKTKQISKAFSSPVSSSAFSSFAS